MDGVGDEGWATQLPLAIRGKMKPNWKKVILFLMCAVLLNFAIFVFVYFVGPLSDYRRMTGSTLMTEGRVTEKQRENHLGIVYVYDVRGQAYHGNRSAAVDALDFKRIHVGQSVRVWYLPQDPDVSTLRDPKELVAGERTGLIVMWIMFPALFFLFGFSSRFETYDVEGDHIQIRLLGLLTIRRIPFNKIKGAEVISWAELLPFHKRFRKEYLLSERVGTYMGSKPVFLRIHSAVRKGFVLTPKNPEKLVQQVLDHIRPNLREAQ